MVDAEESALLRIDKTSLRAGVLETVVVEIISAESDRGLSLPDTVAGEIAAESGSNAAPKGRMVASAVLIAEAPRRQRNIIGYDSQMPLDKEATGIIAEPIADFGPEFGYTEFLSLSEVVPAAIAHV